MAHCRGEAGGPETFPHCCKGAGGSQNADFGYRVTNGWPLGLLVITPCRTLAPTLTQEEGLADAEELLEELYADFLNTTNLTFAADADEAICKGVCSPVFLTLLQIRLWNQIASLIFFA